MRQLTLFEEMATFAVVVEEGSFTAAAKRLKRSKAYVSQQLARLEEALEADLLFRTTRKLELTEAGRECLSHCRTILEAGQEVQRTVSSLKGEMTGNLRITVPVSFGEVFFREIVFGFIRQYPEIKIELELDNLEKDLMAEGYDLAIRTTHKLSDDLVALRVGDLVEWVCVSPDYIEEFGRPSNPSDLMLHRCILNRHQSTLGLWRFEKEGRVSNVPVDGAVVVNHYPLVKQSVLQGHGIARLPSYLVKDEVENGQLIKLFDDYDFDRQPIYVVYPYHGSLPKRTRVMIDYMVDWLRKELAFA